MCFEAREWPENATSDETDKFLLLKPGADRMTKPFSPRELVARAQATIRRLEKA
jgi:DNA-binding response OmpR family regulator